MGLTVAEPRAGHEFPFHEGGDQNWYGVQVAPRHEKKVTTMLREKRLTTFLPLITELHRWSDRKQKVEAPLFDGYTFVRISPLTEERVGVLRTRGVVRLVGKAYIGTAIPDKEIEDVWTLLNSRLRIDPYVFLAVNDRVRIRNGSLAGVEGTLIRKNGGTALVVSVALLQRSLAVTVDGFEIERISNSRSNA